MSHFIGSSPIFLEHRALPNIEASFLMLPFTHLPPPSFTSYIDRKLNHGQKIWDILWGVIWNVLGNKLRTWGTTEGNLMRTFWKHSENTLGTEKKSPSPSPHNPKHRKEVPHECMWSFLIGYMKTVSHHFQPRLIPPFINWGVIIVKHMFFLKKQIVTQHLHFFCAKLHQNRYGVISSLGLVTRT
jgi:hypothetical protein